MSNKRKHSAIEPRAQGNIVAKPAVGTKTFTSGQAVRDALAGGSRQAYVAFYQQIFTPYSALPLALNHPSVVILQHYHSLSPSFDEIFNVWKEADKNRNEETIESAVLLLAHIVQLLTPIPYFRTTVLGIVGRIVASNETFGELMNRLVHSGKKDQVLIGLQLAAACVNTDIPDAAAGPASSSGRMAVKIWSTLVEGGSVKILAKILGMRRRNKQGTMEYGSKDPLDKPDIRHAALQIIIPLLSVSALHAHSKALLPGIYNHLQADPPVTIYRLLNGLWAAITGPSSGIARRVALSLLDENAVENLLGLLNREDVDPTSGRTVGDMTMAFLEAATATPGQGICFPDEGWYPRKNKDDDLEGGDGDIQMHGRAADGRMRKGLHNRILSNVVRKLGSKVIEDQGRIGDWVIKVFQACPEIVAGYWAHSALALDPRLHPRWLATISYVGRIISLAPPPMSTFHEPVPKGSDITDMPARSHPPSVATMIESILPAPLGKVHISKGLQHADHLVQHVTALALARALQKLDRVQEVLRTIEREVDNEPGSSENPWSKRRLELELECRKRVPEVLVVIGFAQKSATLAKVIDENDEPDPKLVAKSAMLTEVALRLFGLYHKTLPSLSREAKFDVGKLLVSASSAKAERREKRQGREGSVISDSGSVGSIGTLGTAGMGGGFGQGRGDVDGFDAMSQVHVLSLLTEVKDFQWTNKAAGSQYSYLYHILILHLSTPHPITRYMTTHLLRNLLLDSIMFEHDHGELDIWLDALPALSSASDITQRAFLVVQQIHLLSFLDECVRRCTKTPFRYLEDVTALLPDYFAPMERPDELVSPLMMTVVEQLRAKIMGQLIATEAAGVVLAYLRRVFLGLAGKMKDRQWLDAVLDKLESGIAEARDKGQERKGLLGSLQEIRLDTNKIFGWADSKRESSEEPAIKMVDQEKWNDGSVEQTLIQDADSSRIEGRLKESHTEAIERYGRLAAQLSASTKDAKYLRVVCRCLDLSTGKSADRLRRAVFASPYFKAALVPGSPVDVVHIDRLVATLRTGQDELLAGEYTSDLLTALQADKKGKNMDQILSLILPWTRFLAPVEAKAAVERVSKNLKRVVDLSARARQAVSDLIVRTDDPRFALNKLDKFVSVDIIEPFSSLLRATAGRRVQNDLTGITVDDSAVKTILSKGGREAFVLVQTLVELSPSGTKMASAVLAEQPMLLGTQEALGLVSSLLDMPGALPTDLVEPAVKTAIASLSKLDVADIPARTQAREVIVRAMAIVPDVVDVQVGKLALSDFTPSLATLSAALAKTATPNSSLGHLVHLALQSITRTCSSDDKLGEVDLAVIADLGEAIQRAPRLDIEASLAEPTITAIVQERLDVPAAVSFAALLVEKCMLKASFIRQQISLLLSSSSYRTLTSPAITPDLLKRDAFVHLLSAMFTANPYISCQPATVEQLLPLYKGTLSLADQRLLSLFQLFESYRHISTASVLAAWSGGAGRSSRPFDAITSVESGKMLATALSFPLRKPLKGVWRMDDHEAGQGLYDPSFVLPLFASALATDMTGLDWVEILRTNILGVAVAALSSRDNDMRSLAGFVLSGTLSYLERVAFQEKLQLLHTLRLVRYSVPTPTSASHPRLPVIITSFLAHVLRSLASPSSPLYPTTSRFLLQRPTFDTQDVPMLFGMLYASGEGHRRDRSWIVRLIKDASRSEADWRLLKRRRTVELMETLYSVSLDVNFRRLVLQALESITRIPPAALSLVHRNHLLTWLASQWTLSETRPNRAVEEERARYLAIVDNLTVVLVHRDQEKEAKRLAESENAPEERRWDATGREWTRSIETMVRYALPRADAARLDVIATIVLRLSQMPSPPSVPPLLREITRRLLELYPAPEDEGPYTSTVEKLFQATLCLPSRGEDKLLRAVEEIGWRARCLPTGVGEWIRREQRLAGWERMQES